MGREMLEEKVKSAGELYKNSWMSFPPRGTAVEDVKFYVSPSHICPLIEESFLPELVTWP